jgi:hypothetical protein
LSPQFEGGTVVAVEKPQKRGTAIVFDGLLQHHGTANITSTTSRVKVSDAVKVLEDAEKVEAKKNNVTTEQAAEVQAEVQAEESDGRLVESVIERLKEKSSMKETEKEEDEEYVPLDRYFYYMSVCIGQDANMEVTGYGGGAKGGRTREERDQAVLDAWNATRNELVVK